MKNLYLTTCALVLLFAFACQKNSTPQPIVNQDIDPAFEPYWQSFKDEADARTLNPAIYEQDISIQFGVLGERIHGQCNEIGGDSITISRVAWDTLDETKREILIFHEIGHCQMSRHHEQGGSYFLNYVVAHTLMIPSLSGSDAVFDPYSPKWREYYIDELFGLSREPEWLSMGISLDTFENTRENVFELSNIEMDEASSPSINVENEAQFQAVFQNSTTSDFMITANDLRIEYSYEMSGFIIRLGEKQLGNVITFRYLNEVHSTGTVSITLRYIDDYIYFYIGDYLVHFREYPKPASLDLSIQSTGEALDARIAVERI